MGRDLLMVSLQRFRAESRNKDLRQNKTWYSSGLLTFLFFIVFILFAAMNFSVNHVAHAANNYMYRHDALNEVIPRLSNGGTFQVDLRNDGHLLTVSVDARTNDLTRHIVIREGNTILARYDTRFESGSCYVAYLRNDGQPDLIFNAGGGGSGWNPNFFIIGALPNGKFALLLDNKVITRPGRMHHPELSLNNKVLGITYNVLDMSRRTEGMSMAQVPLVKYQVNVKWNAEKNCYSWSTFKE